MNYSKKTFHTVSIRYRQIPISRTGQTNQVKARRHEIKKNFFLVFSFLTPFLRLVWYLEVDWDAGGDQQRRQELFQRSVQRVEEIKARRAVGRSHSHFKVKHEIKSEPRKPKPDVQSKNGTEERSSSSGQKKVHTKNEGVKSF